MLHWQIFLMILVFKSTRINYMEEELALGQPVLPCFKLKVRTTLRKKKKGKYLKYVWATALPCLISLCCIEGTQIGWIFCTDSSGSMQLPFPVPVPPCQEARRQSRRISSRLGIAWRLIIFLQALKEWEQWAFPPHSHPSHKCFCYLCDRPLHFCLI